MSTTNGRWVSKGLRFASMKFEVRDGSVTEAFARQVLNDFRRMERERHFMSVFYALVALASALWLGIPPGQMDVTISPTGVVFKGAFVGGFLVALLVNIFKGYKAILPEVAPPSR